MASTADFRNGLVLDIDGQLWTIIYFQHVKPGKGGAFVRNQAQERAERERGGQDVSRRRKG